MPMEAVSSLTTDDIVHSVVKATAVHKRTDIRVASYIEYKSRDEMMHLKGNARLFRSFIAENSDIWDDALKYDIYQAMREVVAYEHHLIDYLNPPHAPNEQFKRYVEYMADNALSELGMKKNWNTNRNPIPFMDDVTGVTLTDFFSGSVTEYTKSVQGSWHDIVYTNWSKPR